MFGHNDSKLKGTVLRIISVMITYEKLLKMQEGLEIYLDFISSGTVYGMTLLS